MRLAAPGLVLGALAIASAGAACTGSAPPEPPIEMPPSDVFERLEANVPTADVRPPLTLDLKSCTFARYLAQLPNGDSTFVLIHPLRSRCELWLGGDSDFGRGELEYCSFPREDLLPIGQGVLTLFRVDDPAHCVFESDPPPPPAAPASRYPKTQTPGRQPRRSLQIETN